MGVTFPLSPTVLPLHIKIQSSDTPPLCQFVRKQSADNSPQLSHTQTSPSKPTPMDQSFLALNLDEKPKWSKAKPTSTTMKPMLS